MPSNSTRYLRVGAWRDSEQSWNFATGGFEQGVSVYALDPEGMPVVPPDGEWAESDLHDRLASDEPKYLVTGNVVGCGGDGEPLLRNLRIIGTWHGPNTESY